MRKWDGNQNNNNNVTISFCFPLPYCSCAQVLLCPSILDLASFLRYPTAPSWFLDFSWPSRYFNVTPASSTSTSSTYYSFVHHLLLIFSFKNPSFNNPFSNFPRCFPFTPSAFDGCKDQSECTCSICTMVITWITSKHMIPIKTTPRWAETSNIRWETSKMTSAGHTYIYISFLTKKVLDLTMDLLCCQAK